MSKQFVHLHSHSMFSLLDGLSKPEDMVQRAWALGQPAVGITDHGSLSGAYQLWKTCKDAGIKPIIGCEFYISPESRHRKESVLFGNPDQRQLDVSKGGAYGHITILARTAEGVRNLYRLQAAAYGEGFWHKPRIDLDLLNTHRGGLICLSGCPGSLFVTRIKLEQFEEAAKHLSDLKDIFGEHLYAETMEHGIDDEPFLNGNVAEIAKQLSVPLCATGDSHYTFPGQGDVHQALLCVQTGSKLENPAFSFDGSGYHLTSREEMERTNLPVEALDNTLVVAESVESYDSVFEHKLRMPRWGEDADFEIRDRAERWLDEHPSDANSERLFYELDTIISLGFTDYFLVVADVVNEARNEGIRIGPARGSAGGSLVAYALGITSLDPIPSGLLFERFINPERVGLPDIDIDISEDKRDRFLDIVREKFGRECVAANGTFGTVGAKASLKDSARVLGYNYKVGEEATYQLPPPKQGFSPTLDQFEGDKDSDIYKLAVGLEGTVRNESIHAAAVIISPEPLADLVPLRNPGGKGENVICFDMHEVEALGFVKTDFLGVRGLKVIDDCLSMLGQASGLGPLPQLSERDELPTDPRECTDPATYELLAKGDTLGVFQLDSSGMRGLLQQVAPSSFGDISAVLALYRPGPMGVKADRDYALRKHNRQRISYPHRELEEALAPILGDTYGVIVYQEQVLAVLAAVGDYNYGTAEVIFNAMRKKLPEKMAAAKPELVRRMQGKGYSVDAIEALWEVLVPFSSYSFNISHTYGYALIAYWMAYLKANHPREFMAAVLSNEPKPQDRAIYLADCGRMGIPMLPPDINESNVTFTPTDEGIRYGLGAIKGVGEKVAGAIMAARPYRNLSHYYGSINAAGLNSGTVRALGYSGAFDGVVGSREGFLEVYEDHCERAASVKKAKGKGQRGVVKPRYTVPNHPTNLKQRRKWEKETIGMALSYGELMMHPKAPLSEPEMVWVKEALERCPGTQKISLKIGSSVVDTSCRVDPEKVREVLKPLGKIEIREEA